MKAIMGTLLWTMLGVAMPAAAAPVDLEPFIALYAVKYGSMTVGDSRMELRPGAGPDGWIFESRADATGLARLFASGTLVQTSWIEVDGGQVRPMRFRFDDGMERSDEDIALEFDWSQKRVRGTSKGEQVDLATVAGLQDPVSIQVATMVALISGGRPGTIPMIDGPKVKYYDYEFQRNERLETPAGTFDTVVYTSTREGSSRVATMWLAPELGYMPVQLEQHRKGKRLFAMYLKKYVGG